MTKYIWPDSFYRADMSREAAEDIAGDEPMKLIHDCERYDPDCPSCKQEHDYWYTRWLGNLRAVHCVDCIREARGEAAATMCEDCPIGDHAPCEVHR